MKIIIADNGVGFNFIELSAFPRYYREFHQSVKVGTGTGTTALERKGQTLLKNKFANVERVNDFVREVMKWGGRTGNRVRGNLYKNHTEEEIAEIIAQTSLLLGAGDLRAAITTIISLKGLHISYGSKILRMMSPQQAGVYDSILAGFLSYPLDAEGYVNFCADCQLVAERLKKRTIKHPLRKDGGWFVADVEAVIFDRLRKGSYA